MLLRTSLLRPALGFVTVAALLAGCSGEAGVGEDVLDRGELEQNIEEQLAEQFPDAPEPIIECPDELEPEVGATTECELSVDGDDAVYPVAVEVTSAEDGEAKFDIEVGENPL